MQDFRLYNSSRKEISIQEGFPKEYDKYGFPCALKYHAKYGKFTLLFQVIKAGKYEIANSDYLIKGKAKTEEEDDNHSKDKRKLAAKSDESCIELHFLLYGSAQINLKGFEWALLDAGSHNLTTVPSVKSEVFLNSPSISTFDVHLTEKLLVIYAEKYPQLKPLLKAFREKKEKELYDKNRSTTPFMFHLIVQIKAALMAGLENEPGTLDLIEQLIHLVIEDKHVPTNHTFDYYDIESICRAERLMVKHLDEKDILKNKMQETGMKQSKFREGFKLLFGYLPHEYLKIKRLEKAHKLATEGRINTIANIAQVCGYRSGDYLAKEFLKVYGKKLSAILNENQQNCT
jgi:AraC-like DNA-binding protein